MSKPIGLLFVLAALLLSVVEFNPALAQGNASNSGTLSPTANNIKKEKRMALVIGNNSYPNAQLVASINDARAMTETLRKLNFDVVLLEDANQSSMIKAMGSFTKELSKSDAIGLFYFAGHGVQSNSKNFLIPVDAKITKATDIERQGIDIQSLLDKFSEKQNGMNILILDACRDNSFSDGGVKRSAGLAAVDGPPGTMVAFATAPGKVAQETGDHGAYTRSVLKHISEPGLPIEEIFKRVRSDVLQATNNAQVPWENTSLVRDFYFKAAKPGQGYRPNAEAKETEEWEWSRIEDSKNLYDFIAFLRRFPKTKYELDLLQKVNATLAKLPSKPPKLLLHELPSLLIESTVGIEVRFINRFASEYYGLTSGGGLLITNVKSGAAAESAGVLVGDVLLSINGTDVKDLADMKSLARSINPGENIDAVIWRNAQKLSVTGIVERASINQLFGQVLSMQLEAKDFSRALVTTEYLAVNGDYVGQTVLGLLYELGLGGVQKDLGKAESLYSAAVRKNSFVAMERLSNLYLTPNSGLVNDKEAFRMAKFTAEHGSVVGASYLAIAYARGVGVASNFFEAVKWSRVAALQNNPTGMYLLGVAYIGGNGGLAKDLGEAKKWLRQASELKYAPAIARLKLLEGQ